MTRTMTRTTMSAVCIAFVLAGLVGVAWPPPAAGQNGGGWLALLDGKSLDQWRRVGDANWRLEGGAVIADKTVGKGSGFLVSKASYKDFMLYAEFWVSDDANSGIFIRCTDPNKIGGKTAYEVNIYDQRPDPKYATGAIVNVAAVNPPVKAGGKWNTYEITARGAHLIAVFNGKKTADGTDSKFAEGPIALQYGKGVVKFRKITVKPL